jgi:hypothetical protein
MSYKNTSSVPQNDGLKFDGQRASNLLAVFCLPHTATSCALFASFSPRNPIHPKKQKARKENQINSTPYLESGAPDFVYELQYCFVAQKALQQAHLSPSRW